MRFIYGLSVAAGDDRGVSGEEGKAMQTSMTMQTQKTVDTTSCQRTHIVRSQKWIISLYIASKDHCRGVARRRPRSATSAAPTGVRHMVSCIVACSALFCGLSSTAMGLTAEEFRNGLMRNSNIMKTSGELFAWHASAGISGFIEGYYAYGKDKAWLEEACRYYDFLISKMEKEPDGYMGWVGTYFGLEPEIGAVVIGDALLIDPMLAFAEIVMKDPALRKSPLGKKAEEYIALARKVLVEKWDKRGGYYEDGMFASYLSTGVVIDKDTHELKALPGKKWSENLNKHAKMGTCFLKLYRITGEPMFKERAEKIFGHYKAIMRYPRNENRYFWNFWEPLAPFDFKPEGDNAVSWIAVHHSHPGYMQYECSAFVEAYHTGIVFTEDDMKKIVNCNLWMWNHSLTNIHFKAPDGVLLTSKSSPMPGQDAGFLWSSLADFDPTIREIYAAQLKESKEAVEIAYFNKVTCKEPPSYKRKYVSGKVTLPDITIYPNTEIIMAVAVPSHISVSKGETIRLACKVNVKGTVKVTLFSEDGKKPLFEIGTIDIQPYKDMFGVSSIHWDGKDKSSKTLTGNYRVRFTLNDSAREWRIKVEE